MKVSQCWKKSAMTIIVALAVVGTLTGCAGLGGGAKSPLVGSWTLNMDMGGKDFDVTLVVNSDLTGTAETEWLDEASAIEDVTSEGNTVGFSCPDVLGIVVTGTIDGDAIEGEFSSDYDDGSFTGVRN